MSRSWSLSGAGGGACGLRGCPSGTPLRRHCPVSDLDHDQLAGFQTRLDQATQAAAATANDPAAE
jgi:hypothetical protein